MSKSSAVRFFGAIVMTFAVVPAFAISISSTGTGGAWNVNSTSSAVLSSGKFLTKSFAPLERP